VEWPMFQVYPKEMKMEWYAVRNVYHFGVNKNGKNMFEERVVCFEASNFEEAHSKAERESKKYAEDNGFEVHSEQLVYKQDGEPLIDGYEIWSVLYESDNALDEFYIDFYKKYEYDPDSD